MSGFGEDLWTGYVEAVVRDRIAVADQRRLVRLAVCRNRELAARRAQLCGSDGVRAPRRGWLARRRPAE